MTFRKLIPQYIDEQLDDSTLNDFLLHLKNCPQCMEELEIHYIVMKGVGILDTNNGDYNLSEKFKTTVRESIRQLGLRKNIMRVEYVIDTLVVWSILASLILFLNSYFHR